MTFIGRILVLYWMSVSAFAAVPSNPQGVVLPPAPPVFDPLSSTYLFKMMLSLFVVLVLMFLVVWLLKRTGRFEGRAGNYPLRVLTQMTVGTRERVLLIAVGDRQMLLGVTSGQIESLGWVDPPIEIDTSKKNSSPVHMNNAFARLLQNQIRPNAQNNEVKGADSSSGKSPPPSNTPSEPRL
ncbi:MAG: flagellar biosynthetic protein FliO [Halothiobacillus sp.]|jgi:flagellar protein FliO/FliZ|uniref:flagellar biosynthetic protein FliO n=1 Tax=Halothiobacillus sp. TaxID=1891311 RepID=UPI002AD26E51|nr:flagellar biosynthetic protein FliO [Halothiobacillus sp.]MDA3878397.1 flagellar biosynthetic protein FliO [Halothiobacillus sp.]